MQRVGVVGGVPRGRGGRGGRSGLRWDGGARGARARRSVGRARAVPRLAPRGRRARAALPLSCRDLRPTLRFQLLRASRPRRTIA